MRYAKAIAALLGGLTPAAIVGVLAVFHVNVNPELIAEIYTVGAPILAGLMTAGGPANKVADAVEAKAAPRELPEVPAGPAQGATPVAEKVPSPDALH